MRFSKNEFIGWFISMILWLPTTIGGWLMHFNIISLDNMWRASFALSLLLALYFSCNLKPAAAEPENQQNHIYQ